MNLHKSLNKQSPALDSRGDEITNRAQPKCYLSNLRVPSVAHPLRLLKTVPSEKRAPRAPCTTFAVPKGQRPHRIYLLLYLPDVCHPRHTALSHPYPRNIRQNMPPDRESSPPLHLPPVPRPSTAEQRVNSQRSACGPRFFVDATKQFAEQLANFPSGTLFTVHVQL